MRSLDQRVFRTTLLNLVDAPTAQGSAIVSAAAERGLEALDFNTGGRFNLFAALRLSRIIEENGVDIIHGHGFKADALGLLASCLSGKIIITTPHGWSCENDFKLALYQKLDRFLFKFMNQVCPLSEQLRKDIGGKVSSDRVRLILNGVDLDELDALVPEERAAPNMFLIGYIGQLIERKDVSTLIAALGAAQAEGGDFVLQVVGDGPLRPSLEAEAKGFGLAEHVSFTGFRKDATSLLKTSTSSSFLHVWKASRVVSWKRWALPCRWWHPTYRGTGHSLQTVRLGFFSSLGTRWRWQTG